MDFNKFKEEFNGGDTFSYNNHIYLSKLEKGRSEVVMDADESNFNFMGMVHGGALFTLADVAAGCASVSCGVNVVTLSASLNYLRPGTKGQIKAIGRVVKFGKKNIVCSVEIFSKDGKLLCIANITMFVTSHQSVE